MRYTRPDPTMVDMETERSGGRCLSTHTGREGERCDLPAFWEGLCRVHYTYGRHRYNDWAEIQHLLAVERGRQAEQEGER
jgi:hypothetical protein